MKTTNNTHTHSTAAGRICSYWHADHSVPSHPSLFLNYYGGHTALHLEINTGEHEEDE